MISIVPDELRKVNYEVLILCSGPNEISNININGRYSENIEAWRGKAQLSSQKLYKLAEQCITDNPNLKRVVIVSRPPRYDNKVKSHLSQYANKALEDIWTSNGSPNKIAITKLNIGCEGLLRIQRYGDPSIQSNAGIHLKGAQGSQHMTDKFVEMLVATFPNKTFHLEKNLTLERPVFYNTSQGVKTQNRFDVLSQGN